MFQFQFKAMAIFVLGIEASAQAEVTKGRPGFPVSAVQQMAESLHLAPMAYDVLAALLQQSDALVVSEDGHWLMPVLEQSRAVIDVPVHEAGLVAS